MMGRFDVLTIVGLVLGTFFILMSISLGGKLGMFWNLPSVFITVGGSFASLLISYDIQQIKGVMHTLKCAVTTETIDPSIVIELLCDLAKKARREGLLGLEDDIERLNDPFFQKGIRMMVDALDPELIRGILETDMEYTARRHELGQGIFRTWASLAPAYGMIGTLIGLIVMLAKLNDPSALGPAMAVALITTFYGSLMANLVFTPLANKLALRSSEELLIKEIILEGIISIQSGMNPRILDEKLNSFLSPKTAQQQQQAARAREEQANA
ncbi:flagellar motor protein MotP [Clostridiales bacterium PH28_bin88]|nr:flagellar motor protein MotP [Clostridiales bacterium PH28_bin88]